MFTSISRGFNRILQDLGKGRNIEAYVVSLIGVALVILDVIGDVDDNLKLTVMIAALVVLVFRSTKPEASTIDLDKVLRDRQGFGPFREFITGGRVLSVYGPSAKSAISEAATLEAEILDKGGRVRILIQNPTVNESMDILKRQLDTQFDLAHDIDASLYTLRRMKRQHADRFEFRLLDYNPGFSLTVVERKGNHSWLLVEFIGYRNDRINNRMHIKIARAQSVHWYDFWQSQFNLMWEEGKTDEQVFGNPTATVISQR